MGAFSNKQEGCHFDQGKSQSNIFIALNNALLNRRLRDVQISATDETNIDAQIKSFKKLSNEAKKIVTRIDTQIYGGSNRKDLRELAQKNGKNLWMFEVDGGNTEGSNAGEIGAGLWLANRIILDLNGLRSSSDKSKSTLFSFSFVLVTTITNFFPSLSKAAIELLVPEMKV